MLLALTGGLVAAQPRAAPCANPSIIKHNGRYHIAYTVQSWTTNSTSFDIAGSTNLTSWTHVAGVNSDIANTPFTWAPEFHVENGPIRIIAGVAATCSNCFRPYVYTARNTGLTSWSGPSQMWGLGTNHIDTFVVQSGSTWHAFTKDETGKYIEHWTTTANLYEGWVHRGRLFSSGLRRPVAGAAGQRQPRIHVDRYSDGTGVHTPRPAPT